ncbi:MAG: pyridoxamine 5'-phosphate oxidase family protein [Gammaproteobacteria bacterium]|nr:pyridoxamine 5'-phosphate oxidase family protein [Gammaproteobacteria bacterium]
MAAISPFHPGEQEIQTRFGLREQIEDVGQRFIRNYLPEEHQAFYANLPFLIVGSVDQAGRPWASLMAGQPGFVAAPDPTTLIITARPTYGDPLGDALVEGTRLGFLGIDYHTRRRNRLTGRLRRVREGEMEIHVDQTFGNCPKFIQARTVEFGDDLESIGDARPVHDLEHLDARAREIISAADHFFIATHYSANDTDASQGTDVSHRGGKPGFVRIDDDSTLTFPDFSGNYHFNTLGNLLLNPRAGLLFIDFASGDLLYIACSAQVIWDGEDLAAFAGAERLVRFSVEKVRLVENALPLAFSFVDASPFLEQTGSWEAVAERKAARDNGNASRDYRVAKVEPESDTITSFYLQPDDDQQIACHGAGQFLPIEILPPGAVEPVRRTYTISNAPNGTHYRLSIKREQPNSPGGPPGVVSNFFHDNIVPGATIRALNPRGQFTLDESSTRPVVLISAGVGITPMIGMLEQLDRDRETCGCTRKVWFIHGARNSGEQAFGASVRSMAAAWPNLATHFRFSRPGAADVEGRDYDSVGRVEVTLLKTLLPFDDYEFYICGPGPFMESIYADLKELNIADERIHYEYFGEGKALASSRPGPTAIGDLDDREPVPVRFAKSGVEAIWDPTKGTLLDLAESEGLEPIYSCRSGVCQTCAVSVLGGSVDYTDPPAAPPPDGMALICSAYPAAAAPDQAPDPIVLDI